MNSGEAYVKSVQAQEKAEETVEGKSVPTMTASKVKNVFSTAGSEINKAKGITTVGKE